MSAHQVTRFEDGKYYVMTPPGERWSDYEGPWDTSDEALAYLGQFINEGRTHSPEMLRMVVVRFRVYPEAGQCDLVKDASGTILNGEYLLRRLDDGRQ